MEAVTSAVGKIPGMWQELLNMAADFRQCGGFIKPYFPSTSAYPCSTPLELSNGISDRCCIRLSKRNKMPGNPQQPRGTHCCTASTWHGVRVAQLSFDYVLSAIILKNSDCIASAMVWLLNKHIVFVSLGRHILGIGLSTLHVPCQGLSIISLRGASWLSGSMRGIQARDRGFDPQLRWICSDPVLLGKALCTHVHSVDPGVRDCS